jgi:hypothetical protein
MDIVALFCDLDKFAVEFEPTISRVAFYNPELQTKKPVHSRGWKGLGCERS